MKAPDILDHDYKNTSAYCFLDLPFYKTGEVKKNPISQDDVDIVLRLLNDYDPTHIFVAGDLTDPHVCCYFFPAIVLIVLIKNSWDGWN